MIESYAFGRMVIDGHPYTSDLIIFPGKINDSWWRISGHSVALKDIEGAFLEEPEVIIIGTGYSGLMKVEEEVKSLARSKGIELIIEKTEKATQAFNTISTQKKAIGAFHLTC
ncbi:MAG: hypothetical protein JSV96_11780 [Candidatus Aminicenantes bacterium]|nr:MAG: hypothetical protein JSV96_11780 [Candidatus Aminicenantes bacterium]